MDYNNIVAIIFISLLGIILFFERKKLDVQKILYPLVYFVMYKTQWGVKAMDAVAKRFRTLVKWFGYSGIYVGFVGMLLIGFELVKNVITIFIEKAPVPGVGLVLPIEAKGVFYVPFIYWVIAIFFVASVHEFAHGVVARRFGMKIKSSGFAFFGLLVPIIPAAFVEPDEKQMEKKKPKDQLAMFAAGPFSNIIFGTIFLLLLLFVFAPATEKITVMEGVEIINLYSDGDAMYPAEKAGLELGEVITSINGVSITHPENFTNGLSGKRPGDTITLITNEKEEPLIITLGEKQKNASAGYLGLSVSPKTEISSEIIEKYGAGANFFVWFTGLIFWLFLLNYGIGLFNLVPLGPIDGGRMLRLPSITLFGKEQGLKVHKIISMIFLVILAIILLMSFFG